jgi:hypothetical protein
MKPKPKVAMHGHGPRGDQEIRRQSAWLGHRYEAREGEARARNVILECDDYKCAKVHLHSADFQLARSPDSARPIST